MKLSLKSIGMLSVMLAASIASATQCPNLKVTVVNQTGQSVSGVLQGTTGNLGSGGYTIGANQSKPIGIYAQNYPQGTTFGVNGNIQQFGQTNEYVNCYGTVSGVNGCPDPTAQATMVITSTSTLATCAIHTQVAPPPPPPPTTVNYQLINNVGRGRVVSATVGVTVIQNGNPVTATQNVPSGNTVKGQITIPANSANVYIAGLGVSNGIWGPSCGPTEYSNVAGKTYVITFSNPSVVSCTVEQK